MDSIARDLAKLREATRDVDLSDREAGKLETAAKTWDLETVVDWCSILEKTWKAGYLARDEEARDEGGELVHKDPGDWGFIAR